MLVRIPGPTLTEQTARWLEEGLAGVILFAGNITSPAGVHRLCRAIRDCKPDALIAVDEEGGEVTRLEATTGSSWPGARVYGVLDDVDLTAGAAVSIARAVADAGANLNLAPVADVVTCAANPVIGNRSFGETPDLVGRHVAAFVRGTRQAGVAACAKHFPGHGATSVDSHLDLPTVGLDRQTLLRDHLPPFADAVAAGVEALMTGHVRYPALDDRPATMSPAILRGLARAELGFDGVIVTDALSMGAIADHVGMVAGAVASLAAGADLLCVDGDLDSQAQVRAGLEAAVAAGDVAPHRLEEAAARVAHLAAGLAVRAGAHPCASAHPGAGDAGQPVPPPGGEGLEAARRALRMEPLPAPLGAAPYVVEFSAARSGAGPVRARLLDALRRIEPAATGEMMPVDAAPSPAAVLAAAGDRPLVIACRDAFRHPAQAELVRTALSARPDSVVVGLGSATDAQLAPGRFVPARGAAPPNVRAVAEALCNLKEHQEHAVN
ncbi:MAG TPA: glycoside hydrolase family 3 N-terminal domain-containing protein [Acidimicrobiales bacterium]|nr:glycoside hydrolase family 3 N-terminal domain-containing protein [Acidimicrobiales bacterium]